MREDVVTAVDGALRVCTRACDINGLCALLLVVSPESRHVRQVKCDSGPESFKAGEGFE